MAIKVKDEVRKGISYTKREIVDLEELIAECDEAIGYMSETTFTRHRNAHRINKVIEQKKSAQQELSLQKLSLKNYAEFYGLKKSDVEAVAPATDEQLEKDWQADLREANKPYNPNDLIKLMEQFDREHPQQFEIV
jgi:hypothetical protein